jgi:putative transposase
VRHLRQAWSSSERHGCELTGFTRSSIRYRPKRSDDETLRELLRALARRLTRAGYRRLHDELRGAGLVVNHKRVYRLYREEGLAVRRRHRKRRAVGPRQPIAVPQSLNERWSMDFVSDSLANGRAFRVLSILDDFSRECLALEVDHGLPAERVTRVLDRLALSRGVPRYLVMDNGPEFRAHVFDVWATRRGVALHFIRPGRPMENAFVESFHGKFRDECLNTHWFEALSDARHAIEAWRCWYNTERRHSSLGRATPFEFALRAGLRASPRRSAQRASDPPTSTSGNLS